MGRGCSPAGETPVWVYDAGSGERLRTIAPELGGNGGGGDWLEGAVSSPDGRYGAVHVHLQQAVMRQPVNGSSRGEIRIFALESGNRVSTLVVPGDAEAFDFAADGETLVVVSTEAVTTVGVPPFPAILLFDVASGRARRRIHWQAAGRGVRTLAPTRRGPGP